MNTDASAPHHDGEALARAQRAEKDLYDRVEAEFGMRYPSELSASAAGGVSTDLHAARAQRRLVAVELERGLAFPGFQFDEGRIRPVIAELIAVAAAHGRTEVGLVEWMVSPTTYLGVRRPVDVIDDPPRLLTVAEESLGVEW